MEGWLMLFAVVTAAVAIGALWARKAAATRQASTPQTTTPSTAPPGVPAGPTHQFVPIPPQQIVAANGLQQIPAYVHRLMQAQKQAAVLMISSLDGQEAVGILRMGSGYMQMQVSTNGLKASGRRQKAQEFFARHGLSYQEEQAGDGHIVKSPIAGSETDVVNMAAAILAQVLDVAQNAGLKFTYEERDLQ